jgi:hypothetical protein
MRYSKPDPQSVFLNVPFDPSYERIFVGLIAALVSLGRVPHCVLEIPELGQGRMRRIMDLMSRCRVSIHDLCRVGIPVRFNMPFELGIAYSLCHIIRKHNFIIMEARRHRVDKTLSDLKAIDPKIHEGRPKMAIRAVYEALGRPKGNPPIDVAEGIYKKLWLNINTIRNGSSTIFNRHSFNELIVGVTFLAKRAGVIS